MDLLRKEIESYLNNEYKDIEAIDVRLKGDIKQVIIASNNLYNFLPTTFYLSTANEASSRGYQNFLDFYGYSHTLRRQFVRFWIDRVYYNDPKVLVNFVKDDENIFKAKSKLPFNFRQGVFINSGYCIILLFLSYFLFIRNLFPAPKTEAVLKKVCFNVPPSKITDIKADKKFTTYFLNVFFGRIKRFSGEFILWGLNMVNRDKKPFLFIPTKDAIPKDLKVKSFLNIFKRTSRNSKENFQKITADLDKKVFKKTFAEINDFCKARVLLMAAQMNKRPVLIIDNIAKDLCYEDFEKIKPIILDLKDNGYTTIFYFMDNDTVPLGEEPNEWRVILLEDGEYIDMFRKNNGK